MGGGFVAQIGLRLGFPFAPDGFSVGSGPNKRLNAIMTVSVASTYGREPPVRAVCLFRLTTISKSSAQAILGRSVS
jgi:hypothetical protein